MERYDGLTARKPSLGHVLRLQEFDRQGRRDGRDDSEGQR